METTKEAVELPDSIEQASGTTTSPSSNTSPPRNTKYHTENRCIIKERAKIRASPKNQRRFSQASPIIAEVPQTPNRSPTNVHSSAGTIKARKNETPKKVKNTNSPKPISKDDRRHNEVIDGVKGKEGGEHIF